MILRAEGESFEGSPILDEFPDELGAVLWQAFRDVNLWAEVRPEARAGLFGLRGVEAREARMGTLAADPAVAVPLTVLTALVRSSRDAEVPTVVLACLQLAHWAAARGAHRTAVAFAQAAAQVQPDEAEPAVEVAELAGQGGMHVRAETWLRRAIGLARRAEDWHSYATAYAELGLLYERRGALEKARASLSQAARAARRYRLAEPRARAHHTLLRMALDRGDLAAAERHLRPVLRAYGRAHPRHPDAMQDVARLWMAQGNHARAVPVLAKVATVRARPAERLLALALLVRAARGAGPEVDAMHRGAWAQALGLLDSATPNDPAAAPALLEVARTAAVLSDWPALSEAARRAVEVAKASGHAAVSRQAAALLESVGDMRAEHAA